QTVKLSQRLVIEPHVIEVRRRDTAFPQAVFNCVDWEAMVMLDSTESLLLRGGDDPAVDNEGRRGVVIEGRNAQDARRPGRISESYVHSANERVAGFLINRRREPAAVFRRSLAI